MYLEFIVLVPQDYHTLREQGCQHVLLDVREAVEYEICHLDDSHSIFSQLSLILRLPFFDMHAVSSFGMFASLGTFVRFPSYSVLSDIPLKRLQSSETVLLHVNDLIKQVSAKQAASSG